MNITENHTTGKLCVDCLFLHANGDMPERMSADELTQYQASIDEHSTGYEFTLGHFHDDDSQCWHAGESCDDDCDCERTEFSSHPCAMCGSTLAGSRDDVTIWRTAVGPAHRTQ